MVSVSCHQKSFRFRKLFSCDKPLLIWYNPIRRKNCFRKQKRRKLNMKKILALMLALCMALAAIPALAEGDLSGTWYFLTFGLTAGSFELNADGTCVVAFSANGSEGSSEGTWTADESSVTITVDGQPLVLIRDGDALTLDVASLEALGMDAQGMDAATINSMIAVSREPGKVTMDEFNAFQNEGTLPEGKTQEEMQAIQTEVMILFLSVMGSMESGDTGSGADTPDAPAAVPELTVVDDNFYAYETYFGMEGMYIARVQNSNDVPLYVSSGSLVLKDADGDEIGRREWLNETGSRYLEPGEVSFVSINADIQEGAAVADYEVKIETTAADEWYRDSAIELGETGLVVDDEYPSYATVAVTNATGEPLSGVNVVIAVKDAEGKLITLSSKTLYDIILSPDSTITLKADISSNVIKYCNANNLTLSEAEAYAWVSGHY